MALTARQPFHNLFLFKINSQKWRREPPWVASVAPESCFVSSWCLLCHRSASSKCLPFLVLIQTSFLYNLLVLGFPPFSENSLSCHSLSRAAVPSAHGCKAFSKKSRLIFSVSDVMRPTFICEHLLPQMDAAAAAGQGKAMSLCSQLQCEERPSPPGALLRVSLSPTNTC